MILLLIIVIMEKVFLIVMIFNGSLSLGMLIKQSVAQLGGIYEITNDNGMQFIMSFNISD